MDRHVHVVQDIRELYKRADYITVHIHYTPQTKQMIDEKIALYRIPVLTGHSCVRITDEGAAVKNKDGEETMLKADTVLIAAGVRPKDMETNRLRETCYDLGIEFIAVGDCRKTGRIREATSSGYFAGRNA